MPAPRIAEKELLTADEMALFTLSQDSARLAQHSHAQLRDHIARARNLRDRARDMYRRQVGRTRSATGNKRGFSGMAVLLCEQYYDFAEELADEYLVMERGEVIARGPGSEMQAKQIQKLVAI